MSTKVSLNIIVKKDKKGFINKLFGRKENKYISIGSINVLDEDEEEANNIKSYFENKERLIRDLKNRKIDVKDIYDINIDYIETDIKIETNHDGKLKNSYVNYMRDSIQSKIINRQMKLVNTLNELVKDRMLEITYIHKRELTDDELEIKSINQIVLQKGDINKYEYELKVLIIFPDELSFFMPSIIRDNYTIGIKGPRLQLPIDIINKHTFSEFDYENDRLQVETCIDIRNLYDFFTKSVEYKILEDNLQQQKYLPYYENKYSVRLLDAHDLNGDCIVKRISNEINDCILYTNNLVPEYNSYMPHGDKYPI